MAPLFVSYNTPDLKYRRLARHLRLSLSAHDIQLYCPELDIDGPWHVKASRKPNVLLDAMDVYKAPVLWIDADATVRKTPAWLDEIAPYDYGIVRYKRYHEGGNLIYFNNSTFGRMMLTRWKIIQETYPHVHDECILTWLWYQLTPMGLQTFFIPSNDVSYSIRNRDASIRQWSASMGHRSKEEIGHRHYTEDFIDAIMRNDFRQEFSFAECFNREI